MAHPDAVPNSARTSGPRTVERQKRPKLTRGAEGRETIANNTPMGPITPMGSMPPQIRGGKGGIAAKGKGAMGKRGATVKRGGY